MEDDVVYCQILSHPISTNACRELQGSHEPKSCFGCAAHSRWCSRCRQGKILTPEIDLCDQCLVDALQTESTAEKKDLRQRTYEPTYCQIVRREVTAQLCLESQGVEACSQCLSPFRFCEQCAKRIVYYPDYGLCLHCTTHEFLPEWQGSKNHVRPRPSSENIKPLLTSARVPPRPIPGEQQRGKKAKLYAPSAIAAPLQLTDRDLAVLKSLARYRFLSSEQLHLICFDCGASMVRRRLRALFDHKLIRRVPVVIRPTPGVPMFVHTIDKAGVTVLAEENILARVPDIPSGLSEFVHRHYINQFFAVHTASLRDTSWQLTRIEFERDLRDTRLRPKLSVPTPGPEARRAYLLPNAYFEIEDRTEIPPRVRAFFLYVDRATQKLKEWSKRALFYTACADLSGSHFQQQFGRDTFRVVIVTNPDYRRRSRQQNILATIRKTLQPEWYSLFGITRFPQITVDSVRLPIWQSARDQTSKYTLLQLHDLK